MRSDEENEDAPIEHRYSCGCRALLEICIRKMRVAFESLISIIYVICII